MTSTSSVGVGLAKPLVPADIAKEYQRRFGGRTSLPAFLTYARTRSLPRKLAEEVRDILVRWGDIGVSGSVASLPIDEAKDPDTHLLNLFKALVKAPVDIAVVPHVPMPGHKSGTRITIAAGSSPGGRVARLSPPGSVSSKGRKLTRVKARATRKKKKKRHVHEGLGYADDADGRGRGLSGGSPYSEFGDTRGVVQSQASCPKCKSPSFHEVGNGSRVCQKCGNSYGLPYLTSVSDGSNGVKNNGVWGNVRVPGGPISTNEGGFVRLTCLGSSLVEVDVGGVKTVHSRVVIPEALRFRVSPYGYAYKIRLHNLLEWIWNKARVGDTICIDQNGKAQYVLTKDGFQQNVVDK